MDFQILKWMIFLCTLKIFGKSNWWTQLRVASTLSNLSCVAFLQRCLLHACHGATHFAVHSFTPSLVFPAAPCSTQQPAYTCLRARRVAAAVLRARHRAKAALCARPPRLEMLLAVLRACCWSQCRCLHGCYCLFLQSSSAPSSRALCSQARHAAGFLTRVVPAAVQSRQHRRRHQLLPGTASPADPSTGTIDLSFGRSPVAPLHRAAPSWRTLFW
jgi:hypothetical protein